MATTIAADTPPVAPTFTVAAKPDRLAISLVGRPIVEYVYRDPRILRPYFAQLGTPGGIQVTRRNPPEPGVDAPDHDTMHPGLWLAFGDLGGADFWRNKGRVEHVRFLVEPEVKEGRLRFATESRLVAPEDREICRLTSRFTLAPCSAGWLLAWDARFHAQERDFTFGDQEEMGFGVRVATPLTEKNGGRILNSSGARGAAKTWGQPARWCDYSGRRDGRSVGITLATDPGNFRESWWHNRDYGLCVANPFGRAAMKQGERSETTVRRGDEFRLRFGACVHEGNDYDPAQASHQIAELFAERD